jgi:methionyl-tRNA synthetase
VSVFYLTTPIYYVNAKPHLGHAYTTILADAMARYRRLRGDEVVLLTGTDEHGERIAQVAAGAGMSPKEYADRIAGEFQQTWSELGIVPTRFIRTTDADHTIVVQTILNTLHEAGEIYLAKYGGQYCFGCERFYTEKEIVDGKCPDHQTPLVYIEEENYFFRMSRYKDWLIDYIQRHPDLIRPERYRNEILGFLRDPLQDLSISRPRTRLEWGIPLPFDDKYVTYVWFDALINYLTGVGYPDAPAFTEHWAHVHHLIGKDILKPHAIYWPCMLAALAKAGGQDPASLMYRQLNVHGYWRIGGGKMSKSVGNVVEALALSKKYGNDAFRYFVMREMVFGLDADFSEEAFVGRLNADLANDLGNLVSRVTTLIANFAGGRQPEAGESTAAERGLADAWAKTRADVDAAMDEFAFQRALAGIWEFIGVLNRYVDTEQPWALAKDPAKQERLHTVLNGLGRGLYSLGIVLAPFLPDAAGKIRGALGVAGKPLLADAEWGPPAAGSTITKLSGLFPRIDDKKTEASIVTGAARPASGEGGVPSAVVVPDVVSISDFGKIDLRVAEVLAAEPVPKSKKLLKLTVSLGDEQRTIVAGIAEHYAPADLVGKKVVVVANLEPAKLMGVESNGMLLAGSAGGTLGVLTLDRDLPPGARVK